MTTEQPTELLPFNDSGNAGRMEQRVVSKLRFVSGLGWLRWDGRRWAGCDAPLNDADAVVAEMAAEAKAQIAAAEARPAGSDAENKAREEALSNARNFASWARTSGNHSRLVAMVAILASRPSIRAEAEELDADPFKLNCNTGTIDLRSGTLLRHDPEDLITKLAPVDFDPDAGVNCPRFVAFLRECMGGDDELVGYLLRFLGYCLTGDTREHVFGLWHGSGRNGKSTLIELMLRILGDYARALPSDVLLDTGSAQHATALMDLRGARFCSTVEPASGKRINDALVKQLTGGDRIAARRMRQDFVEFSPTHKIVMACNARPIVRDQGAAFWARVAAVSWGVSFLGREDRTLEATLEAEAPGILAILVAGCRAWQSQGLCPPTSVSEAREEYRQSQDTIGAFVDERLDARSDAWVPRTQVYAEYREWATAGNEHVLPSSVFYRQAAERGWSARIRNGTRGFEGWAIRPLSPIGIVRGAAG